MPSSDGVGEPVRARVGDELADRGQVLEQLVGDRQPAEPVLELRRAGRRPQRAVLAPDPAHDVLLAAAAQALGDGLLGSVGQVGLDDAGRPVTIASRLASMPASSLFIGTTNASMPSRSSWSVTSSRSMPARGERGEVGRRVLAAVAPVTSLAPAAACSVGSGIVFTVSGPTSPSTYSVSG